MTQQWFQPLLDLLLNIQSEWPLPPSSKVWFNKQLNWCNTSQLQGGRSLFLLPSSEVLCSPFCLLWCSVAPRWVSSAHLTNLQKTIQWVKFWLTKGLEKYQSPKQVNGGARAQRKVQEEGTELTVSSNAERLHWHYPKRLLCCQNTIKYSSVACNTLVWGFLPDSVSSSKSSLRHYP